MLTVCKSQIKFSKQNQRLAKITYTSLLLKYGCKLTNNILNITGGYQTHLKLSQVILSSMYKDRQTKPEQDLS